MFDINRATVTIPTKWLILGAIALGFFAGEAVATFGSIVPLFK